MHKQTFQVIVAIDGHGALVDLPDIGLHQPALFRQLPRRLEIVLVVHLW